MNNKDYSSGHLCPCCGYYKFEENIGSHDICPICYWEDDLVQTEDADFSGGANTFSLNQCRENYITMGACAEQFIGLVRKPTAEEIENVEK